LTSKRKRFRGTSACAWVNGSIIATVDNDVIRADQVENKDGKVFLLLAIRTASGFGKEKMSLFSDMLAFIEREKEERLPGLVYDLALPCPDCVTRRTCDRDVVFTFLWDPKTSTEETQFCRRCQRNVPVIDRDCVHVDGISMIPADNAPATKDLLLGKLGMGKVTAPKDCVVMVSFNDAASGQDAEDLAKFLSANGHPTFCTRIYCATNPGNWRQSTESGVVHCKYYIALMSNGWQTSNECQYETGIIKTRIAQKEVTVIPVYYDDFDDDYDRDAEQHYKKIWNDIQSVYGKRDDSWRKRILELLSGKCESRGEIAPYNMIY